MRRATVHKMIKRISILLIVCANMTACASSDSAVSEVPPASSCTTLVQNPDEEPELIGNLTRYLGESGFTYPINARRQGVEGEVLVSFIVNTEGDTEQIRALTNFGYGLEDEAQKLAGFFKYKPAMLNGETVCFRMEDKIEFRLDRQ